MSLHERAMLTTLNIRQWTARKYDKQVSAQIAATHNTAEAVGRYNKQLIAKTEIDKISRLVRQAREDHYRLTLPWDRNGNGLLTSKAFLEYSETMRGHRANFDTAVSNFLAAYPSLVEQAKQDLNGMFKADDYPPVDVIATKFGFHTNIMPIPDADDIRVDVDEKDKQAIAASVRQQLEESQKAAMQALWDRVYKTVQVMQERLANPEGRLRDAVVDNLIDIADLLPKLNVTDDHNLKIVENEIKMSLTQYDTDQLRENPELRQAVAGDAQSVLDTMKSFMGA